MQSLASQFYAFLITIAIGSTLGMLFDIYRVFLHTVRPRKIINNLGDLLFWIIASIVGFAMLLMGNWGEIRLYVVIGTGLGVGIYFKLVSDYFIYILEGFILLVRKTLSLLMRAVLFIWMVISYPFILIRNIVIIPVGIIGNAMTRAGKGTKKLTRKFVFQPIRKSLLRMKNKLIKTFKK